MATKKAAGTAKNLRDSKPKYLGVKKYHNESVGAGGIIIRQRGTNFVAGENVGMGKDHTLYSLINGRVVFSTKRKKHFDNTSHIKKIVSVIMDNAIVAPTETKAKAAKTVASAAKVANVKTTSKTGADNLEIIEGVGPAINKILAAGGITTFVQLADSKESDLQKLLDGAGPKFKIHSPSTWGEQAGLIRDGKMEEFQKLTKELVGGKRK
jgi:large subunit ribosomal protein L27